LLVLPIQTPKYRAHLVPQHCNGSQPHLVAVRRASSKGAYRVPNSEPTSSSQHLLLPELSGGADRSFASSYHVGTAGFTCSSPSIGIQSGSPGQRDSCSQ